MPGHARHVSQSGWDRVERQRRAHVGLVLFFPLANTHWQGPSSCRDRFAKPLGFLNIPFPPPQDAPPMQERAPAMPARPYPAAHGKSPGPRGAMLTPNPASRSTFEFATASLALPIAPRQRRPPKVNRTASQESASCARGKTNGLIKFLLKL